MFSAWLDRQRSRYVEVARSTYAMPHFRIFSGLCFLVSAAAGVYSGSVIPAAMAAFAGVAFLLDGVILLRLRYRDQSR